MKQHFSSFLDRSAMTLSGLCLVHCLAGTLLLTVFAAGSEWFNHNVHLIGLIIALPLAAVALWRGVALHGRIGVAIVGALGIMFMTASLFVGHGASSEVALSITGVVLLGSAHYWNLRASRG